LASGISNTAKEVRSSLSLLKTAGPGLLYGAVGLNIGRTRLAERLKQSDHGFLQKFGTVLTLDQLIGSKLKTKFGKKNQDTQGKQEGQGGRGGGRPPIPPDIKADKNQDRKIILPEDLLKSGELSLEEYVKLLKKEK
jgi:hypothetical protein